MGSPHARYGSLSELPPDNTIRWSVGRKANVVAAIKAGAISLEEAMRRYELSEEELLAWQEAVDSHGSEGLRLTYAQHYRPQGQLRNPLIPQTAG